MTYQGNAVRLIFFFFIGKASFYLFFNFDFFQLGLNVVQNKWKKKSLGAAWRTYRNIVCALERSLVRAQGFLTLHCNTNVRYPSARCLSGRCKKSRIQDCHSRILQPWKFRVVHWSVTNKNPLGLTINQALVSLWLAIVADVTSCKKLRLGLALKGKEKKNLTKKLFFRLDLLTFSIILRQHRLHKEI